MQVQEELLAQDLLDSIFRVATELVRAERASLMLRDDDVSDFVITRAVGLADDVKRQVRVRMGEGIAGKVAAERHSVMVGSGGEAVSSGGRPYRTRSYVSVPIVVNDVARGVLNVADPVEERDFTSADLATLEMLAQHIAACLMKQDQADALKLLAETDPLTWLFNRRHFDRRLAAEADRARRSERLLALLMVDVDGFKVINDTYGHQVGDQVLRTVAGAIREAVRVYDVATRYGGDEFGIILPETDTESAARVGRRILEKLDAAPMPDALGGARVSLSIGASTFPRPAATTDALIETADAAMYSAKASGGGIRVWQHAHAEGPRGAVGAKPSSVDHVPYLADPSRLATRELQAMVPAGVLGEWNAVVVGRDGQVITIALPQPNANALEAISQASGLSVYPVYSKAADLEAARRRLS